MKCLIVVAALVACAVAADVPVDTPEVAAAKAAHFAEYSVRAAAAAAAPEYPYYNYGAYPYAYGAYPYSSYAATVVTPQGYVADTPEVALAKAAHFAEHAKAAGAVGAYPYHGYPYAYGAYPYAAPYVTPSGYLADTPEVAAAKVAHFAEVAKATHA